MKEALDAFEPYPLILAILGIGTLAAVLLPRFLGAKPFSMPIVLLGFGIGVFSLPLGIEAAQPMDHGLLTERFTEALVIISLMGAGLKIDRPFSWQGWNGTARLLGITMILSIGLAALTGFWVAGFVPATALLLGAAIAPTDPVLASEIQVGTPQHGATNAEMADPEELEELKEERSGKSEEDEFRFTLTSEAGLNDGTAFPFVHAAILLAGGGLGTMAAMREWLLIDGLYKLAAGVLSGWLLGHLLARVILSMPGKSSFAKVMIGPAALASTLIIYGVTQYLGGYGFVAVFVGAVTMRGSSRDHDYHASLHAFSEMAERILTGVLLIAFGGAIAGGLLAPLNGPLVATAIVLVFVVRPVAGIIGLIGFHKASWRERLAISFFGIRGVGSFYYLAYALSHQTFPGAKELWALTGLVVVISVVIHGIAATPVAQRLDRVREAG